MLTPTDRPRVLTHGFRLNFLILAKLAPWTVAQAVYFFLAVYGLAYVKAMGPRFFGFALFAILSKCAPTSIRRMSLLR